ncbi:MAG: glycosyltransferase family 2 protein [Nitrososphaerales archaeon]
MNAHTLNGDYWVCLITKDGEETLGETLDSIIGQSLPPEFIVVINDGSKDRTVEIINERSKAFKKIHVVTTNSRSRDIRRVPLLLNLGLQLASTLQETRYMMVSGDDNWLFSKYASSIVDRMNRDHKIAVASGSWLAGKNQVPHGGGRFVRTSFIALVGKYPVAYGWETWLVYKAMELGYSVKNYGDLRYKHLRPYNPTNLLGWGRAMYSLGFPTYFVLLRFAANFFMPRRGAQSKKASVSMLAGFLSARLNEASLKPMLINDQGLKTFVKRSSTSRLVRL